MRVNTPPSDAACSDEPSAYVRDIGDTYQSPCLEEYFLLP